jgi:poly(A) polymerase
MKKSTLKRFAAMDRFDEHLALHRVDCLASHGGLDNLDFMRNAIESFAGEPGGKVILPDRLVNGNDLIALGYQPGPRFKEILEAVDTEHLEGTLENKKQALVFVQKNYNIN